MPADPWIVLAAAAAEAALGYPARLHQTIPHPVAWVALQIRSLERELNRGGPVRQRLGGILTLAIVAATAGALGLALELLFRATPGGVVLTALVGSLGLAGRSLVVLDRGIDPARRFSLLHHGRPQMVDHLLASQALYGRFRSIEVHNEPLGDELVGYARNVPAAGSWHAPVVATFDIAAAAPGPTSAAC